MTHKQTALTILFVIALWRSMGLFWGLFALWLGRLDWVKFAFECLMVAGLWCAYFNVKKIQVQGEERNDRPGFVPRRTQ